MQIKVGGIDTVIVRCDQCYMYFDDEFRSTICCHDAFLANDGKNNFAVYTDSYLSLDEPKA